MSKRRRNGKSAQRVKTREGSLDFETDPFKANRVPLPFAGCVYFADNDYQTFWGKKAVYLVAQHLRELSKCRLYVHNGGKFDFFYLLEYANRGSVIIRNGRIVRFKIGACTLEDSFPLMPFALAEYQKTQIDYRLFESDKRDEHREEIISYMVDDCRDLLTLVQGFKNVVGPKETIGGAAFYQMKQIGYKIASCGESHDDRFRPYYFGGRVQAFHKGIHRGEFKFYDINSAYPFAMLHKHPHGTNYTHSRKLPKNPGAHFIRVFAISRGALPLRTDDGLTFPDDETPREYHATGWEIKAGLETKTLEIIDCLECWTPKRKIDFKVYVDSFFKFRADAKNAGDKIKDLAYKYLLNSGYGKFAQNPRDFKNYQIAPYGENVPGWDYEADFGELTLWSQPSYAGAGFYDVATGASITGFVRALLWRAICAAGTVFYCDTDSLITDRADIVLSDALGAWKLEGIGTELAIAGKKLYGILWAPEYWKPDKKTNTLNKHKVASKGARLTYTDILAVCRGETVKWQNEAPSFGIKDGARFITREIKRT